MEEGYLDELAEAKDTNAIVLGEEELDDEVDALNGDQGKLGGIDEADGHPGYSSRCSGQYKIWTQFELFPDWFLKNRTKSRLLVKTIVLK